MKKVILIFYLFILCAAQLCPEFVAVLENLEKPTEIKIREGLLYASNQQSILVYDLKTFKFIKKLGRKGEGPGEFKLNPSINFNNNAIILIDKYKVVKFDFLFNYINEIKMGKTYISSNQVLPIGKLFVVDLNDIHSKRPSRSFVLVDKYKNKIQDLLVEYDGLELQKYLPTSWSRARIKKDNIFISQPQKGLYIEVFDNKGNQKYKIEKKTNKIRSNQKHLQLYKDEMLFLNGREVFDMATQSGYFKTPLPEYMPVIHNFWVIGDTIFIKTYQINKDKEKYILLDLEGNSERSVYLPISFGELLTFYKGKFYYVKDNDIKENWELHKIDLK